MSIELPKQEQVSLASAIKDTGVSNWKKEMLSEWESKPTKMIFGRYLVYSSAAKAVRVFDTKRQIEITQKMRPSGDFQFVFVLFVDGEQQCFTANDLAAMVGRRTDAAGKRKKQRGVTIEGRYFRTLMSAEAEFGRTLVRKARKRERKTGESEFRLDGVLFQWGAK